MQKVQVQLEDDLTGGPADETVRFGVDGRTYEIDLSAKHAATLRSQLARFVQRARLASPQRTGAQARTAASRERSRQIRAWAQQQGLDVAGHGRLPASVIDDYEIAQAGQAPGRPRQAPGRPRQAPGLPRQAPGLPRQARRR